MKFHVQVFLLSETIVLQCFSSKMKKVEKSKLACDQLEDWQSVSEVESSRVSGETALLTKKSRHNQEDMFWMMVSLCVCVPLSLCVFVCVCFCVSVFLCVQQSCVMFTGCKLPPLPRRKHLHICFETKEHSAARTTKIKMKVMKNKKNIYKKNDTVELFGGKWNGQWGKFWERKPKRKSWRKYLVKTTPLNYSDENERKYGTANEGNSEKEKWSFAEVLRLNWVTSTPIHSIPSSSSSSVKIE